jgi:hypothetical protein
MNPILDELDARDRRLLRRRAMPAFTPLMLATLAKDPFSDPAWVFEAKLDGQRSLLWEAWFDRPVDHQERERPHLPLPRSRRGHPSPRHRSADRRR